MTLRIWTLLMALAFGGCSSLAPPPAAPSPSPAEPRAAVPQALVAERQWLQSWSKGRLVAIDQRADGAARVDLPREYCFDAGRRTIKPAPG